MGFILTETFQFEKDFESCIFYNCLIIKTLAVFLLNTHYSILLTF